MNTIRFGGSELEFFTLTIHDRNIPEATDYWDGNWLWCTAEVHAGAFDGTLDNMIRTEDLARFLPRLESLYQTQEGEALFDTLEGWLDLRVIAAGRGHIEVRGQMIDDPVGGNELAFRLAIDQTYLPPIIAQIRAALEAFPILGRPQS